MNPVWTIGLMTGTVLDGNIDIAMLRTDGEQIAEFGPYELAPYAVNIRPLLAECLEVAKEWAFSGPEPTILKQAEEAVSIAQSKAVLHFLKANNFNADQIEAIGFHGQTVLHHPPVAGKIGQTRQLGDGQLMANITGIKTIYDFRSEDMRNGGNGAPLAPVYHRALLQKTSHKNAAILNLGGVGNITFFDAEQLIAFDTGPANAPVNDWIEKHGLGMMDRDGLIATKGKVDEERLADLLSHPWLQQAPPKSLDRFDFNADMATGLSIEDGARTLTAFSAACVGKAFDHLPQKPEALIVSGGGRKNPVLMQELADRTGSKIINSDDIGLRGDAVEAECFAFLAVRHLRALPLSFPGTTGVSQPQTGGITADPNPSCK